MSAIIQAAERTSRVLELVRMERQRQDHLWGEQNHEGPRWTGILGEEFGEACQALNGVLWGSGPHNEHREYFINDLRRELVQVAAVAVAWVEAIEREEGSGT